VENPNELWTARLDRTPFTVSLGFELCVQLSAPSGLFRFIVRNRWHRVGGPSCVLLVEELPSAMQAMAAAERAAATLAFKQRRRIPPRQPEEPARSAALWGPAPGGAAEETQRGSAGYRIAAVRRATPHETRELSGA
jgi:hypothetical protein